MTGGTFLVHLSGKLEVHPTVSLKSRDESSIVPSVLDPKVVPAVAAAVREAAGLSSPRT